VQIFKALVNSKKSNFYFKTNFSLAQPIERPACRASPLAMDPFPPPCSNLSQCSCHRLPGAPHAPRAPPPPSPASVMEPQRPTLPPLNSTPHQLTTITPPPPLDSVNLHHQDEALTLAMKPCPVFTAPLHALLLFSSRPSATRTERLLYRFFTAVARPPHCRSRPGEARDKLPVHPSPCCATSGEPLCPAAAARPSSIELYGWTWWSVHRGPRPKLVPEPWTEFTAIFL
jgi:hypothetical protein